MLIFSPLRRRFAPRLSTFVVGTFTVVLGLLAVMPAGAAAAAQAGPAVPSVAEFARRPQVTKVRLSPTGQHIAAIVNSGDQSALALFRTADMTVINSLRLGFGESVVDYWWSGPQQLVATVGNDDGVLGEPISLGELMLLDAADSQPRYLVGQRGVRQEIGTNIKKRETDIPGYAVMVDPTPDDPNSVIVKIRAFGTPPDLPSVLYELNTRTGARNRIGAEPRAFSDLITDSKGRLRYALADDLGDDDVPTQLYRRGDDGDGSGWIALPKKGQAQLLPQFTTRDDRWVYFTANGLPDAKGEGLCLARQPLDGSGPVQAVACRPGFDVGTVVKTADENEVMAVIYEPDLPVIEFTAVGGKHPDASVMVGLQEAFPGNLAVPVNASRDGKLWLVHVYSDRNPGQYVLFNRQTETVTKLFDVLGNLPEAAMRPVQGVQYKGRDGTSLRGYLTLPRPAADGSKPPLVVLPHGGPFFTRESWRFHAESQFLASRGYAVLRVNFRGSDGYGASFQRAGRRQFGKGMIDDLTDGVRHVIGKGLVDGNRIAIVGGSYGGYAALMSATREPGLYKAVVANAAPVDLNELVNETPGFFQSEQSRFFNLKYMGKDRAELLAQSPITHLDALKAPVLIIHGEADDVVPYPQAKKLRAELKKRGLPFEWLIKSDEGHGFVRQTARTEQYEKTLAFLDKYLKK